jgi:hypothetical protein
MVTLRFLLCNAPVAACCFGFAATVILVRCHIEPMQGRPLVKSFRRSSPGRDGRPWSLSITSTADAAAQATDSWLSELFRTSSSGSSSKRSALLDTNAHHPRWIELDDDAVVTKYHVQPATTTMENAWKPHRLRREKSRLSSSSSSPPLPQRMERPLSSSPPLERRTVSVVVPLYKAQGDLGLQLSYLAYAMDRVHAINNADAVSNNGDALTLIEARLVVDMSLCNADWYDSLREHFPNLFTSLNIIWLDDETKQTEYRAVAAAQSAWLQQRYPNDASESTATEATLNVATWSSWTSRHLQTLLEQQRRTAHPASSLLSFASSVSLPYLVSTQMLEPSVALNVDLFRDLLHDFIHNNNT